MNVETFAWTAGGSILAVLFPILKGVIGKLFNPTKALGLPRWVVKYALLLVFGAASALIVLAVYFSQNPDVKAIPWYTALLLGFGSEATIEKLSTDPN